MEWVLYFAVWAVGVGCGMLALKTLQEAKEEDKRKKAAHAAAEARAMSKMKRSQSAKAAAANRKKALPAEPAEAGVTGLVGGTATAVPPFGFLSDQPDPSTVDQSLYGRKSNDLPH